MLPCHKCSKITSNPTDLIQHLKVTHQIRNHWYTCSLCNSTFDQLYKFRKHSERCFKKKNRNDSMQNTFLEKVNENNQTYEELTNEAALDFACKLAANMNVPRNAVFEVIDDTKRFFD